MELDPKLTIPMHFRSEKFGFDVIGEVDAFTEEFAKVIRSESSEVEVSGPVIEEGTVLVLTPACVK